MRQNASMREGDRSSGKDPLAEAISSVRHIHSRASVRSSTAVQRRNVTASIAVEWSSKGVGVYNITNAPHTITTYRASTCTSTIAREIIPAKSRLAHRASDQPRALFHLHSAINNSRLSLLPTPQHPLNVYNKETSALHRSRATTRK